MVRYFFRPEASRLPLLALLAGGIGVLCGLVAFALQRLIGFFLHLFFFGEVGSRLIEPVGSRLGPWIVLVPAAGGFVVGFFIKYGSPKLKGHGIPEAMEAVLTKESRIPLRVAILKPLSAAIAIGSGGPFGAEGPIIQTGGAFGSVVGQLVSVSAAERKILLASGAAAGMAATFGTPIAAVILAIELLTFEFRVRSFIPLVIATTAATAVRFRVIGTTPMFSVPPHTFGSAGDLPLYLGLGIVAGIVSVVISRGLYLVEDLYDRSGWNEIVCPTVGGLAVGLIALAQPKVLAVGYEWISDILSGKYTAAVLAGLFLAKLLAWWLALGSGTSGGVLAPLLMMGGAVGGLFGAGVRAVAPGVSVSPGTFALASMAAVFGASSRAPFSAIVFAFELTRSYEAILPIMLTCVVAEAVTFAVMEHSIMTEKLARRGLPVRQDYEVDPLSSVTVAQAMTKDVLSVPADALATDVLAERLSPREPKHQGYPVVDGEGRLVGVITRGDLLKVAADDTRSVRQLLARPPIVAYPDETLAHAAARMLEMEIGHLPVVDRREPGKLIGYLSRTDVLAGRRALLASDVASPGNLFAAMSSRLRRTAAAAKAPGETHNEEKE